MRDSHMYTPTTTTTHTNTPQQYAIAHKWRFMGDGEKQRVREVFLTLISEVLHAFERFVRNKVRWLEECVCVCVCV